ncbi:TetR family transcriptional regulator [Colwellia sp. 1_MG-2023]|uniref:TetR/AcrR family transcriptional regulator n=1 Tax=Colwellia sp. 1_MG-2023 TaxID=3062649 RepID=UPI0026E4254C|nr:TetR family transcriptional regulator [Colwellia sp. 1_MG-2023]MDO6446192.1 TetR family transcriptional regulator [Colwellia sp. 1_MG-2023]
MTVLKDKALVKRRSKGELTRNQILNAAIEVLATQGIKGTTHRAIATQAQLQLSLTTYYFKDIKELVHEAFVLSSTQTVSRAGAAWLPAFNLLDSYTKTQLKKVALRTELAEKLSEMATSYLYTKIKDHPTELAIEQLLFTEIQITPKLRELAQIHKQALITPFIQLCSYFNDEYAELDADIMLTIFTQLEYRNLVLPVDEIDVNNIHQTVERIINWIMQLKR